MNAISINNPKINASMVEEVGELFYGIHYSDLRKNFKTNKKYNKKKPKEGQAEIEV